MTVAAAWRALWDRVQRAIDHLDAVQQRHVGTALPVAVLRKYADDQAGRLAAQISYSAFLAVFPLLLVLFAALGLVLGGHGSLKDEIIHSALRQFPVVGPDLRRSVDQVSTRNQIGLYVGLVWLLYGALRLSRNAQVMMAVAWGVDRDDLPDYWHWLPRAVGFLLVLGVGFIAGGALAGIGAFGGLGGFSLWVGLLSSLLVNVGMYWGSFVILVRIPGGGRLNLWPGAVFGGVAWTVLQGIGVLLVSHQLRHLSNLYGTFATVLGLIWWMALGAMVTVYATEFNVVVARRLWPVSIRRVVGADEPGPPAAPVSRTGP